MMNKTIFAYCQLERERKVQEDQTWNAPRFQDRSRWESTAAIVRGRQVDIVEPSVFVLRKVRDQASDFAECSGTHDIRN